MKQLIVLVLLYIGTLFPYEAVLYNGTGKSREEKLIALTVAGIVNRDTARLYLLNVFEAWSYNQTDEAWRDIYRTKGSVVFDSTTSIAYVIEKFRPYIKGAIEYNSSATYGNFSGQSFLWQGEFATMLGGLTDRIPLTASLAQTLGFSFQDSVLVIDNYNNDLPVMVPARLNNPKHHWNADTLSTEQKYLALLNWGVQVLLPRSNPSCFFLREITDFAVQRRMFHLNLAGTEDLNFNSLSSGKAEIIEKTMDYLHKQNPNTIYHIYGWMRPEPLIQWFAYFGASFHESIQANFSWHSSFPVENKPFKSLSTINPDTVVVRDAHYMLIIGTEGDASNWAVALQSGAWLSDKRGLAPIGWGWNYHLFELMPFIAHYIYDTATPNDGFVAVTAPLGYAYPDLWQTDVYNDAVSQTTSMMQKYGISTWYGYKHYNGQGSSYYRGKLINNSFIFSKYGKFLADASVPLSFVFDPLLTTQTAYTNYGGLIYNHVNDGTFYGDISNLSVTANRILNYYSNKSMPSFYLAGYQRLRQESNFAGRTDPGSSDITPGGVQNLITVMKALQPQVAKDIIPVTPEYFTALLRKKMSLPNSVESNKDVPHTVVLEQNYPNPFNPTTRISFRISEQSDVSLRVYSITGELVKQLHSGTLQAGEYSIDYNAHQQVSGVYIVELNYISASESGVFHKKMLLVK